MNSANCCLSLMGLLLVTTGTPMPRPDLGRVHYGIKVNAVALEQLDTLAALYGLPDKAHLVRMLIDEHIERAIVSGRIPERTYPRAVT